MGCLSHTHFSREKLERTSAYFLRLFGSALGSFHQNRTDWLCQKGRQKPSRLPTSASFMQMGLKTLRLRWCKGLTWCFQHYHSVLGLVTQSVLCLCNPMDCSLPGSSVHGDSPGKNTGVGWHTLLQGIFLTQGLKPTSPALQADSLLSEPPIMCF